MQSLLSPQQQRRSRGYSRVPTRDLDAVESAAPSEQPAAAVALPRWVGGSLSTWLLLFVLGTQMEFSYFIVMQVSLVGSGGWCAVPP
jgi:hypothetical protein